MKKKLTFRKEKEKIGHAVSEAAIDAVVYIQPPSPGGKLKEFLGEDVPLRPWSP